MVSSSSDYGIFIKWNYHEVKMEFPPSEDGISPGEDGISDQEKMGLP